jgi:hypothetical protein
VVDGAVEAGAVEEAGEDGARVEGEAWEQPPNKSANRRMQITSPKTHDLFIFQLLLFFSGKIYECALTIKRVYCSNCKRSIED